MSGTTSIRGVFFLKIRTGKRLSRVKTVTSLILLLIGLAMIAVAFFAYELNLDNNPQMGSQRKVLALLGVGCIFLAAALLASKWIRRLGPVSYTHLRAHETR